MGLIYRTVHSLLSGKGVELDLFMGLFIVYCQGKGWNWTGLGTVHSLLSGEGVELDWFRDCS